MLGNRLFIVLSRLLDAHISYEIDTVKMTAALCRFSYCLYDLIRLISIACRVQTYDDAVFADRFRYQLTMFGNRLLIWLSIERAIDSD